MGCVGPFNYCEITPLSAPASVCGCCVESASSLSRVDLRQAPRTPSLNVISPNSDVAICWLVTHLCTRSRCGVERERDAPQGRSLLAPHRPTALLPARQIPMSYGTLDYTLLLEIEATTALRPCNGLIQISDPEYIHTIKLYLTHGVSSINNNSPLLSHHRPYR